jgi:hypothetical protein
LLGAVEELVEQGVLLDEIPPRLRRGGFGLAESVGALAKVAGIPYREALRVVVESDAWEDVRKGPETTRERHEWLAPRALDEATRERLLAVCAGEPEVVEAWVAAERVTRGDGSTREGLTVAVTTRLAIRAPEWRDLMLDLHAKLTTAARPLPLRSCQFGDGGEAAVVKHAVRLYPAP